MVRNLPMHALPPILLWFDRDLRLSDHPALRAAVESERPVIPVVIWAPEESAPWEPGAASRWWLHLSLARFERALRKIGSRLILRRGASAEQLAELISQTGATAVYTSRAYEPAARTREESLRRSLENQGVALRTFSGALLAEPESMHTKAGTPFKVFTPFWRKLQGRIDPVQPLPSPSHLRAPSTWPASESLASLRLQPHHAWADGLEATWVPGEAGALDALQRFLGESVALYDTERDLPGVVGTSRLSPHLHFGELSPRMVWHRVEEHMAETVAPGIVRGSETWLRQLAWGEFAGHLLYHFPKTDRRPLRAEYESFPWREDPASLRAWQRGETGYPIVDAGMRELWSTGWMHNRVRMIVASFLVKDLLIPWQQGAEWFWDTLVDADLANNTLGWQWTAGCGADAAPFFRIFNPMAQAQRFAGNGAYVRRWIPELGALPDRWLHEPWNATPEILAQARIRLGTTYPHPMVDHAQARKRALKALTQTRT